MNDVDQKIVDYLLNDARTPHAQIADEIGLSRPAVTERVKKLEQTGVIRGYTAIVDPVAVGQSIAAFISARYAGTVNKEVDKALRDLAKRSEILEIHSVAGEDCFLFKVRAADINQLNEIVNLLKKTPLEMTTKTTIVLQTYFEKIGGTLLRRNDYSK
ncbi:MAG TPA: Lrp/AsnC family transcriptional regulator [bacterium]